MHTPITERGEDASTSKAFTCGIPPTINPTICNNQWNIRLEQSYQHSNDYKLAFNCLSMP